MFKCHVIYCLSEISDTSFSWNFRSTTITATEGVNVSSTISTLLTTILPAIQTSQGPTIGIYRGTLEPRATSFLPAKIASQQIHEMATHHPYPISFSSAWLPGSTSTTSSRSTPEASSSRIPAASPMSDVPPSTASPPQKKPLSGWKHSAAGRYVN